MKFLHFWIYLLPNHFKPLTMNKIKSLISAFAFILIASSTFANDISSTTLDELRTEIASHLENLDLENLADESATMKVKFMVNDKNEVIVLSVDNESFDSTIKTRLNYQKLDTDGVVKNTVISVPITLKK